MVKEESGDWYPTTTFMAITPWPKGSSQGPASSRCHRLSAHPCQDWDCYLGPFGVHTWMPEARPSHLPAHLSLLGKGCRSNEMTFLPFQPFLCSAVPPSKHLLCIPDGLPKLPYCTVWAGHSHLHRYEGWVCSIINNLNINVPNCLESWHFLVHAYSENIYLYRNLQLFCCNSKKTQHPTNKQTKQPSEPSPVKESENKYNMGIKKKKPVSKRKTPWDVFRCAWVWANPKRNEVSFGLDPHL